jgi:hypothetical protein
MERGETNGGDKVTRLKSNVGRGGGGGGGGRRRSRLKKIKKMLELSAHSTHVDPKKEFFKERKRNYYLSRSVLFGVGKMIRTSCQPH